jgi:hypothetical protein
MQDGQELGSYLDALWGSIIDRFDVDICSHALSFGIRANDRNIWTDHKLVFEGVSSFYFVGGSGVSRFQGQEWDHAELSEIYYDETAVEQIIHRHLTDRAVEEDCSSANFVLEIWSSVLFIEAKTVVIDEHRFEVGYPKPSG